MQVWMRLSRDGQLYLTLGRDADDSRLTLFLIGRDPTDVELESIAQTWSEHCSHKTLAGRILYRGPGLSCNEDNGETAEAGETDERQFDNMLKETIFAATQTIRT